MRSTCIGISGVSTCPWHPTFIRHPHRPRYEKPFLRKSTNARYVNVRCFRSLCNSLHGELCLGQVGIPVSRHCLPMPPVYTSKVPSKFDPHESQVQKGEDCYKTSQDTCHVKASRQLRLQILLQQLAMEHLCQPFLARHPSRWDARHSSDSDRSIHPALLEVRPSALTHISSSTEDVGCLARRRLDAAPGIWRTRKQ